MENLEPIKEVEKGRVFPTEREDGKEIFGWSDQEIREVLEASPFFNDLNEKEISGLIELIKNYSRQIEDRRQEFKKAA